MMSARKGGGGVKITKNMQTNIVYILQTEGRVKNSKNVVNVMYGSPLILHDERALHLQSEQTLSLSFPFTYCVVVGSSTTRS